MSNVSTSRSKIITVARLPAFSQVQRVRSVLVYDRRLERLSPSLKTWLKKFPNRIAVHAGESLKTLDSVKLFFERHQKTLEKLSGAEGALIVVGGGSTGDFGAFVASVYRRGVPLVMIPSTWLAAIDSAHGGKTALNLAHKKNQIGTFYPAREVILCKPLLFLQGVRRFDEAKAEAFKVALLGGPSDYQKIVKSFSSPDDFFKMLPLMIAAKMKIVSLDPFEQNGTRQLLNLGHTMGHVWEAALSLSHGEAVAWGLNFALEFSRRTGRLSASAHAAMASDLSGILQKFKRPATLPRAQILKYLQADKKQVSPRELYFIFIHGIAKPSRARVALSALVRETVRQGFCR